ncbi:MAG TPA: aminotransferase class IV [Kofleriaceae bacterium]
MPIVSIDGLVVPADEARISVFDRGLLYGDGCFEVFRTWDGIAKDLDPHLDRLYSVVKFLQLKAIERPKLVDAIYRTIAKAGAGEHRIRVMLTRGAGALGARFAELPKGHAIVIVDDLPPQPEEMALAVVDWPLPRRTGPGYKALAYLDPLIARELARAAGADDALRLDAAGNVVEGATCNIFVVTSGTVVTPPVDSGALPGIVRARVLGLCARSDIKSSVKNLTLRELRNADELFVTSSLRGIVPVTRLDGAMRTPGSITRRLEHAYATAMRPV